MSVHKVREELPRLVPEKSPTLDLFDAKAAETCEAKGFMNTQQQHAFHASMDSVHVKQLACVNAKVP